MLESETTWSTVERNTRTGAVIAGQQPHGVLEHLVQLVGGGHRGPRVGALIHARFEDVIGDRRGALEDKLQDAGQRGAGIIDDQAGVDHHHPGHGPGGRDPQRQGAAHGQPGHDHVSHSAASSR